MNVSTRTVAEFVGIIALLAIFSVARSEGNRAGIAESELSHLKQAYKPLVHTNDSLLKAAKHSDSIVKAATHKAEQVRTRYVQVHDSLYSVDTVEIPAVVNLADSVIEAQDSIISAQATEILTLKSQVSTQAEMIANLNKQVKVALSDKPSRLSKIANAGKWLGVGAVIGYGLAR